MLCGKHIIDIKLNVIYLKISYIFINIYSRFPLKKTPKIKDFYFDYIEKKNALLRNINLRELDKIHKFIKKRF